MNNNKLDKDFLEFVREDSDLSVIKQSELIEEALRDESLVYKAWTKSRARFLKRKSDFSPQDVPARDQKTLIMLIHGSEQQKVDAIINVLGPAYQLTRKKG
jgi:hypothetical protein